MQVPSSAAAFTYCSTGGPAWDRRSSPGCTRSRSPRPRRRDRLASSRRSSRSRTSRLSVRLPLRGLIDAFAAGASVAVAGAYDGRPRNPVLIGRASWAAVADMATGDRGARPFLRAHPELVTVVECADTGSPLDIDTPEDLARVIGGWNADRETDRRPRL